MVRQAHHERREAAHPERVEGLGVLSLPAPWQAGASALKIVADQPKADQRLAARKPGDPNGKKDRPWEETGLRFLCRFGEVD